MATNNAKIKIYYEFLQKYLEECNAKNILAFVYRFEKNITHFLDKERYNSLLVSPNINPIEIRGIDTARGYIYNNQLRLMMYSNSSTCFQSEYDLSSYDTLVTVGLSNMGRHVNFTNPNFNILWGDIVDSSKEEMYDWLFVEAKEMLEENHQLSYELIKEKKNEDIIYLIRKRSH